MGKIQKIRKYKKIAKKQGIFIREQPVHETWIRVSSGYTMLDCALGGGYVPGTMCNIVGDTSTGKTLGAIESVAHAYHVLQNELGLNVVVDYDETESALDRDWFFRHARVPEDFVTWHASETVEGLLVNLTSRINEVRDADAFLYVADSWDAISSIEEMERMIDVEYDEDGVEIVTMDTGGYKTGKAKFGYEFFRRARSKIKRTNCLFMIISQAKKKIGPSFGAARYRAGGDALDFYASHIIFLSEAYRLVKKSKGVERDIGCNIKCKVSKNKRSGKRHVLTYDILDGYGIDDIGSTLDWLVEVKGVEATSRKFKKGEKGKKPKWVDAELLDDVWSREELCKYLSKNKKERDIILDYGRELWFDLEEEFEPDREPKWGS